MDCKECLKSKQSHIFYPQEMTFNEILKIEFGEIRITGKRDQSPDKYLTLAAELGQLSRTFGIVAPVITSEFSKNIKKDGEVISTHKVLEY